MRSRYLIPLAVAVALATPVAANAAQGDWLFRVGLSQVNPKKENLDLGELGMLVVDDDISATFNVTYMLTDHIGTELLAAWPFTHGIDRKGPAYSNGLDFPSGKTRLGNVDHLPPTLSLQWHFNPDGVFRPYIGAGINYTLFSGEELRGQLSGADLNLKDSFGPAGQIGVDIGSSKNWFVNLDVRYIDIDSDVEIDGDEIGTVEIDPWVYGVHVGYRWGKPVPVPVPVAKAEPVAAPPPPPPPPPADSDGDGVVDGKDKCPGTPAGVKVDSVGCPLEQTLKLLFDFDSAELRPESITELERVVTFMSDVPFAKSLIEGHTDSKGSDAYNLSLSDRRAKAVFDYLTSRGVDPARLASVGKGESAPIADNATEEGRQENRRVMLIRTDSGM